MRKRLHNVTLLSGEISPVTCCEDHCSVVRRAKVGLLHLQATNKTFARTGTTFRNTHILKPWKL